MSAAVNGVQYCGVILEITMGEQADRLCLVAAASAPHPAASTPIWAREA